jgi:hypothetical protein
MPTSPYRTQPQTRTLDENNPRIELAALYSALALSGAVVFGTLSVHPF